MISFVIPAYNEEKVISQALKALHGAAEGLDYEVVVVCDGSDRTASRAKRFNNTKVLEFEKRLGKGGALVKGFRATKGDYVVMMDADMSAHPKQAIGLLKYLGAWDVVIGSRYLPDSKTRTSLKRLIASRGFNFLVQLIAGLNYSDTQSGFKAFKREALGEALPLKIKGFAFDVELLKKIEGKGFKVKEVPIKWSHRKGSSLSYSKALRMLGDLFRVVND